MDGTPTQTPYRNNKEQGDWTLGRVSCRRLLLFWSQYFYKGEGVHKKFDGSGVENTLSDFLLRVPEIISISGCPGKRERTRDGRPTRGTTGV